MHHVIKMMVSSVLFSLFLCFSAVLVHADAAKTGVITADALNVRASPDTSSAKVTQLYQGDQVVILEAVDGWYKISYGDMNGWVSGQFVEVSSTSAATITGDQVNIRTSPELSAEVVARKDRGEKVTVLGQQGDWYNVQLSDGTTGWVFKDYISVGGTSRSNSLALQVVSFAKKFMGTRYVYGGNTPNGFDCSGFSKYVFANYGVYLERVASDQAGQGSKVSKGSLRPGDLVFFDTNGGANYINHVGIYIGSGSFVHASSGSGRVMISDINSGFYAGAYMSARRVIRD